MLESTCWTMFHGQVAQRVEVDSNQIKMLIENNQCYTMWEIADILKISKSIKLLVKMKNVCFMAKNETDFLANPICIYVIVQLKCLLKK